METFGEYLRAQREKKGIRLEEIASITKIHLHSLQFLERGSWEELPPEPFIRGFIIAYAKYVGLEPKDVMERYALEHGKSNPQSFELEVVSSSTTEKHELTPPTSKHLDESPDKILNTPRTFPVKKMAFAGLGVLFLIVVGILVSLGKEKSEPNVAKTEVKEPVAETAPQAATPPQTDERTPASNTATVTPPVKEQPPPAAAPEFAHEIVLETKERSWAKIVIDDKAPVEFYSTPGKKVTYQAKEKLKLVLGNSVGATVQHNGETVEGKKVMGTIRYYIYPEGSRFAQDVPKRKAASEPAKTETPPESTESPKTEE